MKRVCIITDNDFIYQEMQQLVNAEQYAAFCFDFFTQQVIRYLKKIWDFRVF